MTIASVEACTGCGDCLSACPEHVLGLAQGRVVLTPEIGECTFCGACAEACAEPVFSEIRVMAHLATITDDCLAMAGVSCMTCRDACPEAAISMRPRVGGPFLPVLDAGSCNGCGACVAPCPSQALVLVERELIDAG